MFGGMQQRLLYLTPSLVGLRCDKKALEIIMERVKVQTDRQVTDVQLQQQQQTEDSSEWTAETPGRCRNNADTSIKPRCDISVGQNQSTNQINRFVLHFNVSK
jgi:hypothetical protein